MSLNELLGSVHASRSVCSHKSVIACALEDEARMLVKARVPAALAERCEAIQAAGGLGPPPPGALADDPPPLAPLLAAGNAAVGGGGGPGGGRGSGLFSDEDLDEPDAR